MHPVAQQIVDHYVNRTPRSRAHSELASRVLPGGDTRRSVYFDPYPTYMERGEGCVLFDADGNRYLDFSNNYTSLIHGHAHPAVAEAVRAQVVEGTLYGSPAACQYELAGMLCERIPSVERVRFCNSGTEATMMAMRLARAHSAKDVILKMDGGYHGTHLGELAVSTPMTEREIDQATDAVYTVLGLLRRYIEEVAPHLLQP